MMAEVQTMTCFTPRIEMEASALYLRIKLGRWCNHQATPRLFYDVRLEGVR